MQAGGIIQTKRFLFDILLSAIESEEKNKVHANGCFGIVGPRKVGKTILLQQLQQIKPELSAYYSLDTFPKNFDYDAFFESLYVTGVRRVYLDEVCKISFDDIADFTNAVKNYSAVMIFVITGSTCFAVKKLHSMIGRGVLYSMPPILYIERLAWQSPRSISKVTNWKELSTQQSYKNYIQFGGFSSAFEANCYFDSVVEDTIQSFLNTSTLQNISTERIHLIVKYISLCQLVYKDKANRYYCDIPPLTHKIQNSISDLYKSLKTTVNTNVDEVAAVCNMLIDTGLAHRAYNSLLSIDESEDYRLNTLDKSVPALLFEYPWYSCVAITDLLTEDTMWGMWAENFIYLRLLCIYEVLDKYRSHDSEEIDAVYLAGGRKCGLEVKYRKQSNVSNSSQKRYMTVAKHLKLDDFILSCIDVSAKDNFYRIDLIQIALELEYCNLVASSKLYSKLSITQLLHKYDLI